MRKIWPTKRSSGVQQTAGGEAPSAAGNAPPAVARHGRELLADHLPVLRAVASRLCRGNAAETEDLVQDVLEKALRSIHALDLSQNPRGWMVTILHNLHIDRYRRRARQGEHVPCDESLLSAPEALPAPDWAALTADDVRRAAAQLPAELRDAYVLFALDGHTYAEVAAALGIPTATVGTRVLRARARLKEMLVAGLAAGCT
ncbi:MAG TPA: RNA polymerase sigma factor [Kofleriaceae bacterium]